MIIKYSLIGINPMVYESLKSFATVGQLYTTKTCPKKGNKFIKKIIILNDFLFTRQMPDTCYGATSQKICSHHFLILWSIYQADHFFAISCNLNIFINRCLPSFIRASGLFQIQLVKVYRKEV